MMAFWLSIFAAMMGAFVAIVAATQAKKKK
jgi:hypothetical protein